MTTIGNCSSPATKELAKVILLTRDEHDLIDDFIAYYSSLFGARNVVIVDNGSKDPRVLRAYDAHRDAGGLVIVDHRPFSNAKSFMTEHMRALAPSCEFMVPLETDEFMFSTKDMPDASFVLEAAHVNEYLASLGDDVSVVRYGEFWGSVPVDDSIAGAGPARSIVTFFDQGWDKLIVRSSTFVRMSQWCHHADVTRGKTVTSHLGLLHYHNTGFKRLVERALQVIETFGYVDTKAPLLDQLARTSVLRDAPIACGHKLKYYDEFLRRQVALQEFRRVHGRLPTADELRQCSRPGCEPAAAVRSCRSTSGGPDHAAATWDQLLYMNASDETPVAFRCCHVRNKLLSLSSTADPPPRVEAAHAFSNMSNMQQHGVGESGTERRRTLCDILACYEAQHNKHGTDKTTSHAYGPLYERLLERHRDTAKNVLEIGVYSGASCCAFADYFKGALVDGIDITLANVLEKHARHARTRYRRLDGTDPDTPRALGNLYDVILDDASHAPDDQVRSLDLFAPYLRRGGTYIIEDISSHTAAETRRRLSEVGQKHGLRMEWHDLTHVKGQFDDIVAVFVDS
jgi:predicted O-methyltransferase YrrM